MNPILVALDVESAAKALQLADQGYIAALPAHMASETANPFFHKGGWNGLYLDGHAAWVREEQLSKWANAHGVTAYTIAIIGGANQ